MASLKRGRREPDRSGDGVESIGRRTKEGQITNSPHPCPWQPTAVVTAHDHRELLAITITETFSGDVEVRSTAHALQALNCDGSACQASMQRFCGSLHGRQGTSMLQGRGEVGGGKVTARWSVVPGSGTGELSSLCGQGGFAGEFGKGWTATVDDRFQWRPAAHVPLSRPAPGTRRKGL